MWYDTALYKVWYSTIQSDTVLYEMIQHDANAIWSDPKYDMMIYVVTDTHYLLEEGVDCIHWSMLITPLDILITFWHIH